MPEIKITHKLNTSSRIGFNTAGFTLMELMVVVAIMMIMATFLSINLAGRRDSRDVIIAQNELVSNIRKVQSYTLSSRVLPNGQPVQYYVLKFDTAKPSQYTIQAMYNVSSAPRLVDVETIKFPTGVRFASTNPIVINRSGTSMSNQAPSCAIVAFKLPYNRMIANNGCSGSNVIAANDDYDKIVNFENNMNVNTTGTGSTASTDSDVTIRIVDRSGTLYKTVTISGVTGVVTFQ